MNDKRFLDIDGLNHFKDWLYKTFILKDDLDKYVTKEKFEELKAEVEDMKNKIN